VRKAEYDDMPWIEPSNPADGGSGTGWFPDESSRLNPDDPSGSPYTSKPRSLDPYEELERAREAYRARVDEPIDRQPSVDPIAEIKRQTHIREKLKDRPVLIEEFRNIWNPLPLGAKKPTAQYLETRGEDCERIARGEGEALKTKKVEHRVYEFTCDVLCRYLALEPTDPGANPREQWKRGLASHRWVRKVPRPK
jgi:hypothetical protein